MWPPARSTAWYTPGWGKRIFTMSEQGTAAIFRIVTLDDIDKLLAQK
jgi:hypothetical protein